MTPEMQSPLMELFVKYALVPLALALFALIGWALVKAAQKFDVDGKTSATMAILGRVMHIVEAVVLEMKQTVVEELKAASADGKITKEEKDQILKHALEKVKGYLGANGLAELQKVVGLTPTKIDDYLITVIEGLVGKINFLSKPAVALGSLKGVTTPPFAPPTVGSLLGNVVKKSP